MGERRNWEGRQDHLVLTFKDSGNEPFYVLPLSDQDMMNKGYLRVKSAVNEADPTRVFKFDWSRRDDLSKVLENIETKLRNENGALVDSAKARLIGELIGALGIATEVVGPNILLIEVD